MSESLIRLTDAAFSHIKKMISRKEGALGLRLSVKQTGCSGYMYVPEIITEERLNDIKMILKNELSLYLDPGCVEWIKGTTIDFVIKNLGVAMLEYQNPNAEGLCGCGESFHLNSEKTK